LSNIITIKNCKVINEGSITEKDILIKDGRFERIANDIEPQEKILMQQVIIYYLE
jgi:Dihydroorotase and related cyclic amidohydrolases